MTTKEKTMSDKPKSFDDLDKKELYRSAIEDFAVDVKEGDNAKVIKAALLESGVEWKDYVAQHPEVKEEETNVITSPTTPGEQTPVPESKPKPKPEGKIITAEPKVSAPNDQYLIKMVRENPLYSTRGYKFTQEHPYALVSARDAEYILNHEDGFRQAFPSELSEYYG